MEKFLFLSDEVKQTVRGDGRIGVNLIFSNEIKQMGEDIASGGGMQQGGDFGIEPCCDGRCCRRAVVKGCKNLRFAGATMGDEVLHAALRIGNRIAMSRQEAVPIGTIQPGQAGHVIPHVAIGGRDDARTPTHDMIAGKENLTRRKAEMAAQVTGRVKNLNLPVGAVKSITVADPAIGDEIRIQPVAPGRQALRGERGHRGCAAVLGHAESEDRRAGPGPEPGGEGGMVAMGMGDEDQIHRFTRIERGEQGRQMTLIGGPRIHDGDAA